MKLTQNNRTLLEPFETEAAFEECENTLKEVLFSPDQQYFDFKKLISDGS